MDIICSICLYSNVPVDYETRCKHHFHQKCLFRRLSAGLQTCPICLTKISRSPIVEKRIIEENYKNIDSLSYKEKIELFAFSVVDNNMKHFMEMVEYFQQGKTKLRIIHIRDILVDVCKNENMEMFDVLMKLGDGCKNWGKILWPPIRKACKVGNLEILEKLIQLDECNYKYIFNALRYASIGGHTDVVEMLIHMGFDINIENLEAKTPLHLACKHGHLATITKLIQLGANVNSEDDNKLTPLIYACENGNVACFEKLMIESDADFHFKFDKFSRLFCYICKFGHVGILNKYVEMGARIHFDGYHEWSPLHEACASGHVEMAARLVDLGVDINCRVIWDRTPLFEACENGHLEVVNELIQLGANVFLSDKNGETPLHAASAKGHLEVCKRLIYSGCKVNSFTDIGMSPLHEACQNGHIEIVQLLLDYGAIQYYNANHSSPAYYANKNGHKQIYEKLIKIDVHGYYPDPDL